MEKVSQRNKLDAIMELLELHIDIMRKNGKEISEDDIEKLFLKYHTLVLETDYVKNKIKETY